MAVVVRLIEFVESIVVEWVQMKMVELRRSEMVEAHLHMMEIVVGG